MPRRTLACACYRAILVLDSTDTAARRDETPDLPLRSRLSNAAIAEAIASGRQLPPAATSLTRLAGMPPESPKPAVASVTNACSQAPLGVQTGERASAGLRPAGLPDGVEPVVLAESPPKV